MKSFCKIGIHRWYTGAFRSPVWGRTERHCLDCPKTEYWCHKDWKWIAYDIKVINGGSIDKSPDHKPQKARS